MEPQRLPPFLGSTLHGALGRALYRTVCAFPKRDACPGCPLYARCSYPALFQTPAGADESLLAAGIRDQAPRPLVLAPESRWTRASGNPFRLAAGQEVPVRFTLVGRAIADLPIVVVALQRVARHGLGIRDPLDAEKESPRPRLELLRVTSTGDHTVYDGASDAYTPPPPNDLRNDGTLPLAAGIDMVTPLRLKTAGRLASRVEPAEFVAALARRANALSVIHGSGAPVVDETEAARLATSIATVEHRLRLVHVSRYSSTQHSRMTWPGLMGHLIWRGEGLGQLWPLLRFGERAQIGKATTFGFGRYALRAVEP